MACKVCTSQNRLLANAELVLTPAKLRSVLRSDPVYITQKVAICADCGHVDLKVPKKKQRLLNKKKAAY